MPQFEVSIAGSIRKHGVTNYIIYVSDDNNRWIVWRRYSAILDLHEALQKHMRSLPPMPPKAIFSSSKQFAHDRQKKLEEVLQAIVSRDPELTDPLLSKFFRVPAYVHLETDEDFQKLIPIDMDTVSSFRDPDEDWDGGSIISLPSSLFGESRRQRLERTHTSSFLNMALADLEKTR